MSTTCQSSGSKGTLPSPRFNVTGCSEDLRLQNYEEQVSRLPGYPPGAKGFQPFGRQIHQYTTSQISKPVGHPLCYGPAATGSPFSPSTNLPNSMSQLGMYTLLARQPKSSLCGCFLCTRSLKTRDICPAFLISGYLPDWTPMQAKAKQGHPTSSRRVLTETLAQGVSGPQLSCPSVAVGAKGIGV